MLPEWDKEWGMWLEQWQLGKGCGAATIYGRRGGSRVFAIPSMVLNPYTQILKKKAYMTILSLGSNTRSPRITNFKGKHLFLPFELHSILPLGRILSRFVLETLPWAYTVWTAGC
jgi:hypothetical protein